MSYGIRNKIILPDGIGGPDVVLNVSSHVSGEVARDINNTVSSLEHPWAVYAAFDKRGEPTSQLWVSADNKTHVDGRRLKYGLITAQGDTQYRLVTENPDWISVVMLSLVDNQRLTGANRDLAIQGFELSMRSEHNVLYGSGHDLRDGENVYREGYRFPDRPDAIRDGTFPQKYFPYLCRAVGETPRDRGSVQHRLTLANYLSGEETKL
ncbi:MAG: hypothetical protein HY364_02655 [Candidatus Aenigmarchaeota archaeon]|nr:hypothetical protein [Candidatus Aenigmarchaeota archaeon]